MRLISAALVVALAACGGDEPDPQPAAAPAPGPAPAMESAAAPDSLAMPDRAGPSESATGLAESTPTRLYSIQVGSFLDSASADQLVGRLRGQGWPVWSAAARVGGRTFHRVRVGALPTVAEARRLGSLVARRYGLPIWLAPVTPGDHPPANAVEATRQALNQG